MITCRLDISYPLIKLSQYSTKLALEHFTALQGLFKYLKDTIDDGIYFWRQVPRKYKPIGHLPTCVQSNSYEPKTREQLIPDNVRATVDSDYANDVSHRKSVTGIIIKIRGACIYYKTRF